MPSHDASSMQTKRATPMMRSDSGSSATKDRSQAALPSSATPPSHSLKASQHRSHSKTHLVGRSHQPRVPSYGKGLNKLIRLHDGDATQLVKSTTKQRRRSLSHTPSTSPRPQHLSKRNGSAVSLAHDRSDVSLYKNVSQISLKKNPSQVSLKKNSSRVSLKRNGSTKALSKTHKAERVPDSTEPHPVQHRRDPRKSSVHFDLGNEDQDIWTEVSTSESPSTTRHEAHTNGISTLSTPPQQNSVKPDSPTSVQEPSPRQAAQDLPLAQPAVVLGRLSGKRLPTSHASRTHPPDPHAITARLLQRHPPQNAPPQMSTISATVTPRSRSPHSAVPSQTSTLISTPGMQDNVVSRFGGSNTVGAPAGESISPALRDFDDVHRSRASRSPNRRSSLGDLRPDPAQDFSVLAASAREPSNNHSHSSRTQQKLWLQRASSTVEPQQLRPGTRVNGLAGLRGSAIGTSGGLGTGYRDGKGDPKVQKQFQRTYQEYLVVRRYKDPLGEAISRLNQTSHEKGRRILGTGHVTKQVAAGRTLGLSQSLRDLRRPNVPEQTPRGSRGAPGGARDARGRSSMESSRRAPSKDDGEVGPRNAAEKDEEEEEEESEHDALDQLLRRMWERPEVVGGD